MKSNTKVAAIHDLSGVGRCSLTVILPTLSAMGIQVCPLHWSIISGSIWILTAFTADFLLLPTR